MYIRDGVSDFDDLWRDINISFLTNANGMIEGRAGQRAFSFRNQVRLRSFHTTMNIGHMVGFSKKKWADLLRAYVDQDKMRWFIDRTKSRIDGKSKVWSVPFAFNQKSGSNGACLIGASVVAGVPPIDPIEKKKKFLSINFYSRVAETTRRMMADFILFHKIAGEIVSGRDDVAVEVNWNCHMMYQSAMVVPAVARVLDFEGLGFTIDDRVLTGYPGIVEYSWNRYRNGTVRKYAQAQRIMKIVRADMGGKLRPNVPVEELSLWV